MNNKPLADSIRPTDISEIVGQTHLLGKGCLFREVMESANGLLFIRIV